MDKKVKLDYINKIRFSIGGFFNGYDEQVITFEDEKLVVTKYNTINSLNKKTLSLFNVRGDLYTRKTFLKDLISTIDGWEHIYDSNVLDGTQWSLDIIYSGCDTQENYYGHMRYPSNFLSLLQLMNYDKDKYGF